MILSIKDFISTKYLRWLTGECTVLLSSLHNGDRINSRHSPVNRRNYMSTEINTEYGADQIQILEGLEAVRKRPGMYIGSTSARGLQIGRASCRADARSA